MLAAIAMACVFSLNAPAHAIECVPYARQVSGVAIMGDAWTWWGQARTAGYQTGGRPQEGAVMVFKRSGSMRRGHVAVVRQVVDSREVIVDHANWASRRSGRKGRIDRGVSVIDVSPRNDWSMVRVWYPIVDDYGTSVYPLYGFVYGGSGDVPEMEAAVVEVKETVPVATPFSVRPDLAAPGTLQSQFHGATVQIRAGKPVVMGRPVVSAGDLPTPPEAVEPACRPTERADEARRPSPRKPQLVSLSAPMATLPVKRVAVKPAASKISSGKPMRASLADAGQPPALPSVKPTR
ncbi:CHAP domain-containing protein [Oleomonas cavernae]|nr:CHAP domain-containing protein [Oleomonas cavernae]